MQFRKRKRAGGAPKTGAGARLARYDPAVLHHIDFEMMLKGSIYQRKTGSVRQYAVTVNGSTRVVTSGEAVDRATYEALLKAGAIHEAGHVEAQVDKDTTEEPDTPDGP